MCTHVFGYGISNSNSQKYSRQRLGPLPTAAVSPPDSSAGGHCKANRQNRHDFCYILDSILFIIFR